MRRGTTPLIQINLNEDLTGCWYRVIFSQPYTKFRLVKKDSECELSEDGKTIKVRLSQDDTYNFDDSSKVKIQVRYGLDDKAFATNVVRVSVDEILEDDVIE